MPEMSIKKIFLKKAIFELNEKFDAEALKQEGLVYTVSTRASAVANTENAIFVQVRVATPEKEEASNYPFLFDIVVGGFFKFNEKVDEKIAEQFRAVNCPAILFPYLREVLADLTGRSGLPPLHINPVNFVKLRDNEKKESTK